jgi:hypothetical protein
MSTETQRRSRPVGWIIAAVVVIVLVIAYVLTTASSNSDFSRVAVRSGIVLYCQQQAIQPDCEAYADTTMSQHDAQIMDCHRQYMYPAESGAFYECLKSAGILPA